MRIRIRVTNHVVPRRPRPADVPFDLGKLTFDGVGRTMTITGQQINRRRSESYEDSVEICLSADEIQRIYNEAVDHGVIKPSWIDKVSEAQTNLKSALDSIPKSGRSIVRETMAKLNRRT